MKKGEERLWDVLAFKSDAHLEQLTRACLEVGASYVDYEVTPSFRYVVRATKEQADRLREMIPWAKYWIDSKIRHNQCNLVETDT